MNVIEMLLPMMAVAIILGSTLGFFLAVFDKK